MPRHTNTRDRKPGRMAKRRLLRKKRRQRPELTPREMQAKRAAAKRRYNQRRRERLSDEKYKIESDGIRTETQQNVRIKEGM